MAKMDYRRARSQSRDSYRWSAPSLNTGKGPGKSTKTPEQIRTIRRQFLINCVRAELRGERYPGVPRAIRRTELLLKTGAQKLIRMWVEQQTDLNEAIEWVRGRDAAKIEL